MESEELTNAKWYYYSYTMDLKGYDRSGKEVQPLALDVKLLRTLKVNTDTTNLFFVASSKDTLNTCSFKPLDLVGITVIRNRLYLPIYHAIVFDTESDSIVLEKMNKQNLMLQKKVLENKDKTSAWLRAEAKRRKEL
ncbi:MAG: hypothetical protein H7Y86_09100 [Rhizobacter sp.]|nr:hypothetical protein [Ferruginibacter sp.]